MKPGIVREMVDFYRFFWKTQDSEKQIVFYVENNSYRAYLDGIIDELVNTHKQVICYVTSDPQDKTCSAPGPGIHPFYLRALLPTFMLAVQCKVFVMTLLDLNQFHLKRSRYPVHYAYVFHSLVSTHMVFRKGAYDHYDSILCVGPYHKIEIRKNEEIQHLPAKMLIEAGYYRLERIYKAYKEFLKQGKETGKPVALIAPSWGKDNIIETCGDALVGILLEAGYAVIVRPHPETTKRSPQIVHALSEKFNSNPDFTLELSVATDDSLLKSDVLISDYSGIALEYAFGTERPVLFMDVPLKIHNPDYKEIGLEPVEVSLRPKIGLIASPKEIGLVPQLLSRLIDERENYRETIARLRQEYIYAFGHSSEIGAWHIMSIVNGF